MGAEQMENRRDCTSEKGSLEGKSPLDSEGSLPFLFKATPECVFL